MDTPIPGQPNCQWCQESVQSCRKQMSLFEKGTVTFEGFAYNASLFLIEVCCETCMRAYFDSLPDSTVMQFNDYLQSVMESEGPSAFVWPFIMPTTEEEMRLKLPKMQPNINQLCRIASEKASVALRRKQQCE
jgi:hypothetical protein